MRFTGYALALAAVLALGGCPDKDKHASIESMNAGIQAFNDGNYSGAVEKLKDATGQYRDNHQAWYTLGQVYGKKGEWENAAEAFEEAVKAKGDDAMYHYHHGLANFEQGKIEEAREPLEKAVEQNGDLFRAHWYLGRVYQHLGEPKKAAEHWSRAAQLNPYFGEPFAMLGQLYLTWDMIPQAVSVLEQGKKTVIDPKEKAKVFYVLGLAYDAQQKWDKSIEAYESALEHSGDNPTANFQLGLALGEAGKNDEAMKQLEEYIAKANPKDDAFNIQQARKRLNMILMDQVDE